MPKKIFTWILVVRNLACFRAFTFLLCSCSFPGGTMCPRYSTSSENHVHVSKLRVTPASCRRCRTVSTSLTCCYAFAEKMMTSSKNTRHICHFKPERITTNACWKVAGALVKPKGIDHQCYIPQCVVNAVFSWSSLRPGTFQYPAVQSRDVNTWAPPKESRESFIRGTG